MTSLSMSNKYDGRSRYAASSTISSKARGLYQAGLM
eukprot:CAMPEP_0185272130 /NCGR_PEP_ID=MMETSP1359-20130426/46448_1 /TAXON_ID=552665 /ORGANISM="Bigelowiella longifila, Strain CCMP242" /LENGTH=35 /DNA_ID= /DNA_START= /DNA_END= /DNA_ORIENTATION=